MIFQKLQSYRVAFISEKYTSHLYSSMGLARAFAESGCIVEYWGDSEIESKVVDQGFTFRRLWGMWSRLPDEIRLPADLKGLGFIRHPLGSINNLRIRRRWAKQLEPALRQFDESLEAICQIAKPDLVIFAPFVLAYYPFFRIRGIPAVVLSSKPLAVRDPLVPPYTSRLIPYGRWARVSVYLAWLRVWSIDVLYRLQQSVARMLGAYVHEELVRAAAFRCKFDLHSERLRRWIYLDLHFRSVPEWALWTPGMDFPRTRELPRNVSYVGPCVDLARKEQNAFCLWDLEFKYLVYVAVGTIAFRWSENIQFLSKVAAAFRNCPEIHVIISTGDKRTSAAIHSVPPNVSVLTFAPQVQILKAADLAITHAGAGTVRECILNAVPMLAYPRNLDQMGNSARIVYQKIGLRGDRDRDSEATIRAHAVRILKEKDFRENITRLKASIQKHEKDLLSEAIARVSPSIRLGMQAS